MDFHRFEVILSRHNLKAKSQEISFGRGILAHPDHSKDESVTSATTAVVFAIPGFIEFRQQKRLANSIASSSPSINISAHTFFDLNQIEPCYGAEFRIPSNLQTVYDWSMGLRERITPPTIEWLLTSILSLIAAVEALHSENQSYLMDLSVHNSIWVDTEGKFHLLEVPTQGTRIQLDKQIIYDKHLDQLRQKELFLYPPEILKATLDLQNQQPLYRNENGDVLAIGVILLLILARDNTISLGRLLGTVDCKKLIDGFSSSKKQIEDQVKDLLCRMIEKYEYKRITLVKLKTQIHSIIEQDVQSRRCYIRETLIDVDQTTDDSSINKQIDLIQLKITTLKEDSSSGTQDLNELHNSLARLYLKAKKTAEAKEVLLKMLELDAKCAFALHELGLIEQGFCNYSEALSYFQKSYEASDDQKRVDSLYQAGRIQLEKLSQIPEAIISFEKCQVSYINPGIASLIADLYTRQNSHEKASKAIKSIKHLRQEYEQQYRDIRSKYLQKENAAKATSMSKQEFGAAYFEIGDYSRALTFYNQTDNSECKIGVMECYINMNQMENAVYAIPPKKYQQDRLRRWAIARAQIQMYLRNPYQAIQYYLRAVSDDDRQGAVKAEIISITKSFIDPKIAELQAAGFPFNQQTKVFQYEVQFSMKPLIEARNLIMRYQKCFQDFNALNFNYLIRSLAFNYFLFMPNPSYAIALMDLCADSLTTFEFDMASFLSAIGTSQTLFRAKHILKDLFGGYALYKNNISSSKRINSLQYRLTNQVNSYNHSPQFHSKGLFNLALIQTIYNEEYECLLQASIEKDECNADSLCLYAKWLFEKQKPDQALEYAIKCLKVDLYHEKMRSFLFEKAKDRSIKVSALVKQGISNHKTTYLNTWIHWVQRQQWNKSYKYLKEAHDNYPLDPCLSQAFNQFKFLLGYTGSQMHFYSLIGNSDQNIFSLLDQVVKLDWTQRDAFEGYVELNYDELPALISGAEQPEIRGINPEKSELSLEQIKSIFNASPSLLAWFLLANGLSNKDPEDIESIYAETKAAYQLLCNHGKLTQSNNEELNVHLRMATCVLKLLDIKQSSPLAAELIREATSYIESAVAIFNKLLKNQPNIDEMYRSTVEFIFSNAYFTLDNHELALLYAKQCQAHSPAACVLKFYSLLIEIAVTSSSVHLRVETALTLFEEIVLDFRLTRNIIGKKIQNLSRCLLSEQRHHNCLGFCYFSSALTERKAGNRPAAIKACQKALSQSPSYTPFMLFLSTLYSENQEYKLAQTLMEQCLDKSPSNLVALEQIITNTSMQQDWSEVLKYCFRYFSEMVPTKDDEIDKNSSASFSLEEYLSKLESTPHGGVDDDDQKIFRVINQLITAYKQLGNHKEAIHILRRCVAIQPSNTQLIYQLATSLLSMGSSDEAAIEEAWSLLNESIANNSNINPEYLILVGQLYASKGRFKDAKKVYRQCAALDPDNPVIFQLIGDCVVSASGKCGEISEAYNAYNRQLLSTDYHGETKFHLAELVLANEDNQAKAVSLLVQAIPKIKLASEKSRCYSVLITEFRNYREYHKCIEFLKKFTADLPQYKQQNDLQIARLSEKNLLSGDTSCLSYYMQYLEAQPLDAAVHYTVANVYCQIQQSAEAFKHFTKAFELNPNMWECHFRLAKLYFDSGDFASAKKELIAGLEINPTHAIGLSIIGTIHLEENHSRLAIRCFEECLHYSDGRIPSILEQLGRAYIKTDCLQEARACFEASLKQLPTSKAEIRFVFANLLIKLKEYDYAQEILNGIVLRSESKKSEVVYMFMHGRCSFNQYNFEGAYKLLEKCLDYKIDPKSAIGSANLLYRRYLEERESHTLDKLLPSLMVSSLKSVKNLAFIIKAEINLFFGKLNQAKYLLSQVDDTKCKKEEIYLQKNLATARLQYLNHNYREAITILENLLTSIDDYEIHQIINWNLLFSEVLIGSGIDVDRGEMIAQSINLTIAQGYVKNQVKYLGILAGYQRRKLDIDSILKEERIPPIHIQTEYLLGLIHSRSPQSLGTAKTFLHTIVKLKIQHMPSWKLLAQVQMKVGEYDSSISLIDNYLLSMPPDFDTFHTKALSLYHVQQFSKAETIVNSIIHNATNNGSGNTFNVNARQMARAFLLKAQIKLALKQFVEARTYAMEYLAMYNPDCADGNLVLAQVILATNTAGGAGTLEANSILEKIVKKYPKHLYALQCLGNLRLYLGQIPKLRSIYNKLRMLDPPIRSEIMLDIGRWALALDQLQTSYSIFSQAFELSLHTDIVSFSLLLGTLFKQKNYDQIIFLVKQYDRKLVSDVDLLLDVVEFLYSKRKFKLCVIWAAKIRSVDRVVLIKKNVLIASAKYMVKEFAVSNRILLSTMDLFTESLILDHFDKYEVTLTLLGLTTNVLERDTLSIRKLLAKQTTSSKCQYVLSLLLFHSNELEAAEESLKLADVLSNNQNEIMSLQLWIYMNVTRIEADVKYKDTVDKQEIKQRFMRQLEMGATTSKKYGLLLWMAGKCLFGIGSYNSVINFLGFYIKSNTVMHLDSIDEIPISPKQLFEIKFMLGEACLKAKKIPKSMKLFSQCLKLQPSNIPAQVLIAQSYFESENITETLKILYQIIFKSTATAESYLLFARVKIYLEEIEQAALYLQKALALDGNLQAAKNLLCQVSEQISYTVDVIENYENLIKLSPNNPPILKKLLKIYQSQDETQFHLKLTQTLQIYESIIPQQPLDADIAAIKAQVLLREGQPFLAVRLLNDYSLKYEHDPSILFMSGQAHHQTGNYSAEISSYLTLLKEVPVLPDSESRRVNFALANAYLYSQDLAAAEQIYSQLIKNNDIVKIEYFINMGVCQIQQHKPHQAMSYFKQAVERFSRPDKHLLFFMAFAYSMMQGYENEAIATYLKCLDYSPDFVPAALNLSVLLRRNSDTWKAENILKRILKIHPQNLSLSYHLALTYFASKSPWQAVVVLQDMIDNFNERQTAMNATTSSDQHVFSRLFRLNQQQFEKENHNNNMGSAYEQKLDTLLQYPHKNPPDLVAINLLLAIAYRKAQLYDQGIQHLEHCSSQNSINVYYCYHLAILYAASGNIMRAQNRIMRCQQLQPKLKHVFTLVLSILLHNARHFNEEVDVLEDCIHENPQFYEALLNLACTYLQLGMTDQAIETLQKASAINPSDPNVYFNLGNAYAKQKNIEGAMNAYKECLTRDPQHSKCQLNLSILLSLDVAYTSKAIEHFEAYQKIKGISYDDSLIVQKKLGQLHKRLLLSNKTVDDV